MGSNIKLEHYVPQFYLRNFSVGNNGKSLFCFDKCTSKRFIVNVRKIACEKYFYDVTKADQLVEINLAKTESMLGAAYDKLITKKDLNSLSWTDRVSIANFVAVQELRTREMREFLGDMVRQFTVKLSEHKLSDDIKKQLEEINKAEYPKEFQIRMFQNVKEFSDTILSMKWILIENNTKMLFWTSDHPINRYNPKKDILGNLGYLSSGIQIFFPLTPLLSLCLCDLVECFAYPEKMKTGNIDNVIFENHLQMRWSTRFVFSQDDEFPFAKDMLEKEPELRNVNRKRAAVN
jgi:hypothetical protein